MTEAGTTSSRATSDGAPAQSKASQVIVVDRTLHPLLSSTVTTPSTSSSTSSSTATATATSTSTSASPANSISSSLERLHRLHGSSLIQSSSYLLSLSPSTTATALAIFHRSYHRTSLTEVDVWSTSMACVSVAGKVEEDLRRLSQIVAVFVHLYRRRRLGVGDDGGRTSNGNHVSSSDNNSAHNSTSTGTTSTSSILTDQQKSNLLRYIRPLPQNGPVYQAWSSALLETETLILRQLGFTLYWIPDHHPHKFILYFLRVLRLDRDADGDSKGGGGKVGDGAKGDGGGDGGVGKGSSDGTESSSVAQRSWNYCNDACLLDLSVRYEPEIIACAAILLATSHNLPIGSEEATAPSTTLPPMHPRPWWEVFVGPDRESDLMAVCNALLALASPGSDGEDDHRQETNGWEEQKRRAMRQFVPSLVVGGSFNDPGSYVWKALAD